MGAGGVWELAALSARFCSEPKTALTSKSTFFLKDFIFF